MQLTPTTLTGRHVWLEPLTLQHASDLEPLAADQEVWRYMPFESLEDPGRLRAWIGALAGENGTGQGLAFACIDLVSRRAVGITTYMDVSARDRRLEIGRTWLGRPYWRTAMNTECKYLLLTQAFENLGCNRVQLKTDARNLRSQAAIERLGAIKEGVLRSHMITSTGLVRDTVMYSIVAPEWPAVKARLVGMLQR
jgi:RimJ/RimL family protein N-acetyltransferase